MNTKNYPKTEIVLNLVIVILAVAGISLMLTGGSRDGTLQASGISNFKYYTVLTNVFCGIVSLIQLIFIFLRKDTGRITSLKLAAVCGVTVTFSVVAFFFGPLYGYPQFYQGGNLFFHLLQPLVAIFEFILVKRKTIPFRHTVFASIPTLVYGFGYMLNILINGVGGPWPDSNDFYAFLNWGWTVGILIFAGITFLTFAVACIFRYISNKRS